MNADPRQIVADGYDVAAAAYAEWLRTSVIDPAREAYRDAFAELVPEASPVLELGCGGGGPSTQRLATRFALTGIDISSTQIAMARERVPSATFLRGDMTRFDFEEASFDGIAAFYSLIHLPYGELPAMLGRISRWLRPGGVLVTNLGARTSGAHYEPEWFAGVPMYWGGHTREENLQFLEEAGLRVVRATVEDTIEEGKPAPQLWVLARKPEAGA